MSFDPTAFLPDVTFAYPAQESHTSALAEEALSSAPGPGSATSNFDADDLLSNDMLRLCRAQALVPRRAVLLREHQELVLADHRGEISKADRSRLRRVRWELDRLDDAAEGDHLTRLETLAERQAGLARQVDALRRMLEATAPSALLDRERRRKR